MGPLEATSPIPARPHFQGSPHPPHDSAQGRVRAGEGTQHPPGTRRENCCRPEGATVLPRSALTPPDQASAGLRGSGKSPPKGTRRADYVENLVVAQSPHGSVGTPHDLILMVYSLPGSVIGTSLYSGKGMPLM